MPHKLLPALALLACLPATALANPVPARAKGREDVLASGRTVLLGTWTWKVEGNKFGDNDRADFWWEQVTERERRLVPQGGAGWAILRDRPFEKLTRQDLVKANYSTDKLTGTLLTPDTVVAVRTADGKFAKMRVVRYRELHDFSFPEVRHLKAEWIRFALQQPNVKEYHLEVDWVLYKEPARR
jgi:hypothetical protein